MKRKDRGTKSRVEGNGKGSSKAQEKPQSPKKGRNVRQVKLKDREVFMDNDKTEGGRVKLECEVIKTYWDKVDTEKGKRPKSPNLNCRVETVGAIISEFGVVERQWVVEMGFGGLLFLAGKRLPRMLCYWLMTKLDPIRRALVVNSKCRYQLVPQSVHWVFGIPCGGKKVPDEGVTNAQTVALFEKYGSFNSQGYRQISIANVLPDVIKKHNKDDDSAEFKLAFLIFLLGDFMCPSACSKLSHNLWPAVTVFNDAHEYDWCGFLLDNLMSYGRLFSQKFYREGYAKGCGGCTYFLALFYIDHLDREPIGWGVFPRIKAWTNEDVNTVKVEDRLRDENGEIISKGDFGELGCINVAYGEQHPRAGRDTMGPGGAIDEAVKAVINAVSSGGAAAFCAPRFGSGVSIDPNEVFPSSKVKRKLGPADKSNPQTRMAAKKGLGGPQRININPCDEAVVETDESEDDSEVPPGFGSSQRSGADDPLATLVFSQEYFGGLNGLAGGSQSQGCNSDSLFNHLFEDFVVGGGPKIYDDPNELGDGVGVDGLPCNEIATENESYNMNEAEVVIQSKSSEAQEEKKRGPTDTRMGCSDKMSADNENGEGENAVILNTECNNMQGAGSAAADERVEREGDERDGAADNVGRDMGPDAAAVERGKSPPHVGDACSQSQQQSPNNSRPKREKRVSQSLNNNEFYVDVVPRANPNSRARLAKFVMTTGAIIADSAHCTGEDLMNIYDLNIPVLQCDGMYADVMNCYSVLSPHCDGVDDSYIRTAAKLYTKMWRGKYEGRGVRYMMDPCFAMKIQLEKGAPTSWGETLKLCKLYEKEFVGFDANRFNVIFVPVLNKSHWWCVGVSVNTKSVWVIDSMSLRSGVKEKQLLRKVLMGVELFFQTLSPSYQCGLILQWPYKSVKMQCQSDGNSCGVRMLLGIKACADRFVPEVVLRSPIDEERQWLLNDDVMHPLNELKLEVRKKIDENMSEGGP